MTLTEIESYYGKEAADWVRKEQTNHTGPFAVRLINPEYKRSFVKSNDVVGYLDPDGFPVIKLPDDVRYTDIVRVEVEDEEMWYGIIE